MDAAGTSKPTSPRVNLMIENFRAMMKKCEYPKKHDSPEERRWKHDVLLSSARAREESQAVEREVARLNLRKRVELHSPASDDTIKDYTCSTYEEFQQIVLQSVGGFMIVLDTKGIIVFVAQDIWNILRFQPSEIVGTELINFLPDDQKWFVEKKITLAPPFRNRVGTTIEFCCDFKRGDSSEIGPPTYEYVKFILSLKNAIEEPVFFEANQSFRVTHSHYLCDEHFYFVGTVCILKNDILKEIYKKVRFTKIEIKEESDEGSSEYKMGIEAKRRRKMDMKDGIKYCKMEAASTRSSLSLNDNTNIENAQQDTWQENAPINVKRSDSSTSLQNKAPSPGLSFSPTLPWQTEVDPRLQQEPIDIELPVDPIFLYHSSNDDDDDDDGPPHLEKYVDFESYDSESPDGSLRAPPILRAFYCIEETSSTDDSSDWRELNENSTSFRKNFLHPPNLTCLLNEETNQEAQEMPVLRRVYSFTTTDDQRDRTVPDQTIASPCFERYQREESDQSTDIDVSYLAKYKEDFCMNVFLSPTNGNSSESSRDSSSSTSSIPTLQTLEDFMLLWQETPPSTPQIFPNEDALYDHSIKFKQNVLPPNACNPVQTLHSEQQNISFLEPLKLTNDPPSELNPSAEPDFPTDINLPIQTNVVTEASPPIEVIVPTEINLHAEINTPTEINLKAEINIPTNINLHAETNLPTELNLSTGSSTPAEVNLPTDLNVCTEGNLITELNPPTQPIELSTPTEMSVLTEPNVPAQPALLSEVNILTELNLFSELTLPTDPNLSSDLNITTDLDLSSELNLPTDLDLFSEINLSAENQSTDISSPIELELFTELNLLDELDLATEPTEPSVFSELDDFDLLLDI